MNRFLIPLGMCKVIVGNPTGPIQVSIKSNGEISEYSFYLSDPVATDLFQLPYSLSTGDKIRIETNPNPKIKKYVDYHIQLKEKSIETDKGSCIDYASSKYKSYANCVNIGLREKILPVLGCMVPWISRDEHCTGIVQRRPKQEKIVQWLRSLPQQSWGESQYKAKACPFPCTAMFSHATFKHTGIGDFQTNFVNLNLDDSIEEEKIIPAYDLAALLVEVGSSLGLWLGLSVVGVFDILVLVTLRIQLLFKSQELDASTREDED